MYEQQQIDASLSLLCNSFPKKTEILYQNGPIKIPISKNRKCQPLFGSDNSKFSSTVTEFNVYSIHRTLRQTDYNHFHFRQSTIEQEIYMESLGVHGQSKII